MCFGFCRNNSVKDQQPSTQEPNSKPVQPTSATPVVTASTSDTMVHNSSQCQPARLWRESWSFSGLWILCLRCIHIKRRYLDYRQVHAGFGMSVLKWKRQRSLSGWCDLCTPKNWIYLISASAGWERCHVLDARIKTFSISVRVLPWCP